MCRILKVASVLVFISIFLEVCLSYCPPLKSPRTTYLTCTEPGQTQSLICSSSWLRKGTIAHFKCMTDKNETVGGRIRCFEDGVHRHIQKTEANRKYSSRLPCGITRNLKNPEIHVYGYSKPVHYWLGNMRQASKGFQRLALTLHNELRRMHSSPPLVLDEHLCRLAQFWADKASINGRLDMVPGKEYGQNIFKSSIKNVTVAVNDAVLNWYNSGLAQYSWKNVSANWHNSQALQFSQLIWTNSKRLGVGASTGSSGSFVIAFYDPPGNAVIEDDGEQSEKLFELNVPLSKIRKFMRRNKM